MTTGLRIQPLQKLKKNKLTNCGHLKYVWNVFCVLTNHRWDLQTTETTENGYVPLDTEQIVKYFPLLFWNFLQLLFFSFQWNKKGFSCLVWCDYMPSNFNVLKCYLDVGFYLSVFTAKHAQPNEITIAIKGIQATLLTNRLSKSTRVREKQSVMIKRDFKTITIWKTIFWSNE